MTGIKCNFSSKSLKKKRCIKGEKKKPRMINIVKSSLSRQMEALYAKHSKTQLSVDLSKINKPCVGFKATRFPSKHVLFTSLLYL